MRFVVLALVAGCNPVWKAEGIVIDKSGAPVEGANVVVACAGEEGPAQETKTTTTGRFAVGGTGAARAMGCALEVSKPGKHLKTVRMMDVCFRSKKTNNYDLLCSPSEGKITLE